MLIAHGGGFVGGHRRMKAVATLTRALPAAGYLVVAFDYRLLGLGRALAEAVEDAVTVDRWWRERAVKWGADLARTSVIGLSAGALVMTSAARRLGPIHKLAGVYGPYDLTTPGRVSGLKHRLLLGTGRADRVRALSPAHNLDLDVPLGLFHGLADGIVPVEHALTLARYRRDRGLPVEVHLYDDVGHGFIRDPDTAVTRQFVADLVAFLGAP